MIRSLLFSIVVLCYAACSQSDSGPRGVITGITPFCAPLGAEITIRGTGFGAGLANTAVNFAYAPDGIGATTDAPLTVTSVSSTEIKVVVPFLIPYESLGHVTVQYGGQQVFIDATGNNNLAFNVMPYTLISSSPDSAKVGGQVVIKGAGFGTDPSAIGVFFFDASRHGTEAVTTSITDTELTFKIPSVAVIGKNKFYINTQGSKLSLVAGTVVVVE